MTDRDLHGGSLVFSLNPSGPPRLISPPDGSDLDTVSHGSLDSANDSAERTSIDTDFTKMDSSDDGFSTGAAQCFSPFSLF